MIDYLFDQQIFDTAGSVYRIVGRTDDENVLHVQPAKGHSGGMSYCTTHQIAYSHKETCEGCRNQVVDEPHEAGVTSCDTPEIQRN